MKQYQQCYKEETQNERQRSFEFEEYPQIQEYYSTQVKSGYEKPKRIIVTEIYDESTPQTRNNLKKKEYFNYFTESSSLPYHNHQGIRDVGQKRLFSQNKNIYMTANPDMDYNSNFINEFHSTYNKKLCFGRTDLREEYPNPSNERVNIRKKIFRGSNTPKPNRYNFNLEKDDEDFIENFQYYESKNIRDKNNKKYQSITRVTGYSNLIPLSSRRIENNFNCKFNSVNLSRYNNMDINQNLKHNYSNIDVYKRHEIVEKRKLQTPEKFTQIQIQKTTKNYEIKKKPEPVTKATTNIQTKTQTQAQTSKRKYESTKIPQTTTKNPNVKVETTKKKYEVAKPQTTTKSKNIQIETSKRKYESTKKPEPVTKTTTNVTNVNTKKYEIKKQETVTKTPVTQLKTNKKYDYKINIDTSKYKRDSNKLYFKSHGKYQYKDNISDKDIIDSRKSNVSEAKNIKKVEIIDNTTKKKEFKKLDNLSKTNINQTNKTTTSYKKTDNTAKSSVNNKTAVKTNISANINNKYNTANSKITKTTTEIKKTTNITNTNANNNNKGFKNSYKSTNITIKTASPSTNNKRTTNIANVTNITKKNYDVNKKVAETHKEGLNLDNYKKEYVKTEIKRNDMSGKYLNNTKSVKKIFDNRNIGLIENKEIKEVYKMQNKRREKTPKMKIKKKLLGDNYKYYESKFMQNPNENTNINSYTIHQRRNERVIYGTEEIEIKKMKSYKLRPEMGGYKIKKKKKLYKQRIMPVSGEENNYVVYNKYYQDNYNYTGGRGYEEYEYEDGDDNNYEENYEQEVIYYQ